MEWQMEESARPNHRQSSEEQHRCSTSRLISDQTQSMALLSTSKGEVLRPGIDRFS